MARQTRSISCKADVDYVKAVAVVAARRKQHSGDLTREALDKYIGEEIKAVRALFFAPSVPQKKHDYIDDTAEKETA